MGVGAGFYKVKDFFDNLKALAQYMGQRSYAYLFSYHILM